MALLFEQNQRVQRHSPLSPYELELNDDSSKFGQSIGSMTLWQNTGATIVALLHNDELVVSPGPYAVIERGDTLYFVGKETTVQAVQKFFYHD